MGAPALRCGARVVPRGVENERRLPVQPEVGASTDTWGTKINTDLDTIDAVFKGDGTGGALGSSATANAVMYLNGTKKLKTGSELVFDGSNLGLGVTPSAWGGNFKAIQVGSQAAFSTATFGLFDSITSMSSNVVSGMHGIPAG